MSRKPSRRLRRKNRPRCVGCGNTSDVAGFGASSYRDERVGIQHACTPCVNALHFAMTFIQWLLHIALVDSRE